MTLIGMLHHRRDPKTVIKSYAYAAVARAEGADFFYFSPGTVDFSNRSIRGQVYENGNWIERVMPFPDVIYNAGSPEKLARSREIIGKLKEEIPFTTNSIGNKWGVNERLKEAKEFANYLIPSEIVKDTDHFFRFSASFKEVVFKPIDGRKGKGIYFIKKLDNGFDVLKDSISQHYTKEQLMNFIESRLKLGTFILQPYIRSVTKSGHIYDFRLHVQKNGEGDWVITTIYPRIAPKGSIIANINNGGFTNYLDPFLEQEFKEDAFNIRRTLEHFSLSLANHLDELQMVHYGEVIDEIGVDVGLDENLKIWIYEVNWRPGCPPAFYLELDVVINTIKYAIYLAKNEKAVKAKIKAAKKKHRKLKRNIPIIAITGSAGKTTSKAFLASILSKKWKTFESSNYWNTTEHTKKHAEEINSEHEAVVLEYGMAYPGVITKHCSIIQPNISIITNIGLAHVGNFDSDIKKLAKAKSEIIHGMDEKGLLILNQDDENSKHLETNEFKGKILTVGVNTNADYRAYDIKYEDNGMSFKIRLQGQEIALYIPILGEHHVFNALNAIAVADYLGFTPMEIKTGLLFNAPLQRMTTYHCKNNITIIDDSVHSHPQAVRAAIDVLAHVGKHRKIAVIGQMRELGDLREREYRKVGEYVCNKGVDILITYGFRTDEISSQAMAKGFSKENVYHFRNKEDLHTLLINIINPNDTILIKGASKTKLYETVEFLNGTFS